VDVATKRDGIRRRNNSVEIIIVKRPCIVKVNMSLACKAAR
jgi:hypothetical protein